MKLIILTFFTLIYSNLIPQQNYDEELLKKFILENPQIIIESLQKYEQKLEKQNEVRIKKQIISEIENIEKNNVNFFSGNKNAERKIFEFFDYNCGYCKRAHNELKEILKTQDVKIIYINLPILSENSLNLAKLSIAIGNRNHNHFNKFHDFILSSKKSQKEIENFIKDLNLDYSKIKKESESDIIKEIIDKNLEWARLLNIQGTPAFIIKNELINGFVGKNILESILLN